MYIFVRQDLSIPQQLVQASHAAHESGLNHEDSGEKNSIIIFGAKNKDELNYLLDRFNPEVTCYPFYEPYKNIGLTAFATKPITEDKRKIFKGFRLWKPLEKDFSMEGN